MEHTKKKEKRKNGTLSPEAQSSNTRDHKSQKNTFKHQGSNVNINNYQLKFKMHLW